MEAKLYSSASNAKRAARAAFPEGNFEIVPRDGKFGFRGLEIEITSAGEQLVQPTNDANMHVEEPVETAVHVFNPFGSLVAQATGEKVSANGVIGTVSHTHKLDDTQEGCPLCGAEDCDITYVEPNQGSDDHRRECHACGERFNRQTGQRIRSGYKNENVSRGHKIQKDRPCQNGVKRPSDGTQCAAVWELCDTLGNPSAKDMRAQNDAMGWNMNNTLIELYNWRKFNGITGRAK
jgi:hypothetical protein